MEDLSHPEARSITLPLSLQKSSAMLHPSERKTMFTGNVAVSAAREFSNETFQRDIPKVTA